MSGLEGGDAIPLYLGWRRSCPTFYVWARGRGALPAMSGLEGGGAIPSMSGLEGGVALPSMSGLAGGVLYLLCLG